MAGKEKKTRVKGDFNRHFGENLYTIRTLLNIKQEAFADILGINRVRYQRIESGWITNDYEIFIWIVDHIRVYCGVDVYTLLSWNLDKDAVSGTVRYAWNYFQSHPEVESQLLPAEYYQVITPEQKKRLKVEKRLKNRKDAKKVEREEEDRLYVNVLLGDRIKYVRQASAANQDVMAQRLCITTARLSTLERGLTMRNYSILIQLLLTFHRLDVTLADFLGEKFDRKEIKQRVKAAQTRNRDNVVKNAFSIVVKTR